METKIHFCDLCNESVPQSDLDLGRAVLRHNRVICSACEEAMTQATPAPPRVASGAAASVAPLAPAPAAALVGRPAPGGSGAPVAMVAMGLAFSGVALLVALGSAGFFFIRFSERQEELLARLQAGEGEQAARAARLQEALGDLAREQEATLAGLRADGERSAQRLVELERSAAGASAKLGADLSRLEERLEGLSGLSDSLERQERELARLAEETRALRDELDALALRGPAAPAATPAQAGGAGPAALARTPGGETAAQEPTWKSWLGDLASQNSGTRWQAVQSLGATGDPAVVPHLAPMLKDADIFVRMASARILGDLGAIEAIPALIDALEDEEASVREASLVSLRGISGQSIPFDPLAKDAERAKRVKAWRDWWAEASEQLHGQGKMRPRG